MPRPIIINGKFLRASLEGMPRVAREVCHALDKLLDEPGYSSLTFQMVLPRGPEPDVRYRNIALRQIGAFQGFLWEQIDLPLFTRGRYCLNFTNTAPLLTQNGCVVVHDAQFVTSRASHHLKSRLLYNGITPRVARRYRTVVTVSQYARGEILSKGVCRRDDIHVIANGADHVLHQPPQAALLEQWGLAGTCYALANSYVHTHKNVAVLLAAFARMPDKRLVLFGSSQAQDYRERQIAVPDNVLFVGRVSDAELISLMAHAHAFLFPSTTEGFGLPPLEAMLLGCPTVCASAGALPENCGDAVLYADPHCVTDWTNSVCDLWDDDALRTRLSKAGRARAQSFRWEDAARSYLDLIAAETGRVTHRTPVPQ